MHGFIISASRKINNPSVVAEKYQKLQDVQEKKDYGKHLIEALPLMSSETWKNVGKASASEGEPGSSPKKFLKQEQGFLSLQGSLEAGPFGWRQASYT